MIRRQLRQVREVRRIFDKLPVHVQLAVLVADCAPWLMSCDVVDCLHCYEEVNDDLAINRM